MDNKDKFLIVVDGSYFLYTALFGATKFFIDNNPEEAAQWIKPVEECDQDNLPDLVNCDTYKKILKKYAMKRLEAVDEIAKSNFPDEIDACSRIDIVFALDDSLKHSFRKAMYPEYKAQRVLVRRQYKLNTIKDYMLNVLFKEIDIESQHGYSIVKVDGAEGDDVIAVALTKLDGYIGKMLIASDHDFLQIDGVREFDLFGKEAKRLIGEEELSPQDYLMCKILMGDKSDNIKQVFTRCGPKTALKWIKDKDSLKKTLLEDHASAERYILNKKMISFDSMPEDLSSRILKSLNESVSKMEALNVRKANDWTQFMSL